MTLQWRVGAAFATLLSSALTVFIIVSQPFGVQATTPPTPNAVPKPAEFPIVLPWEPGRSVALGGNTYGKGDHQDKDYHALDFYIASGVGGRPGHEKDVRAIASGTVVWAGWYEGDKEVATSSFVCYGNSVAISHEGAGAGFVSYYTHLASISTTLGAHVNQGDIIGQEGNTGEGKQYRKTDQIKTCKTCYFYTKSIQ